MTVFKHEENLSMKTRNNRQEIIEKTAQLVWTHWGDYRQQAAIDKDHLTEE